MNKTEERLSAIERLRSFYREALTPEMIARNLLLSGEDSVNLRLWILREKKHLSVEDFAMCLGITPNKYKKYESRGVKIPTELLRKISKKFNVSLDWLLCKTPH